MAYMAGIFDGEGCICLRKCKKRSVVLDISFANTNEWLIQWAKFAFGGKVYLVEQSSPSSKGKNWKPYWRWAMSSNKALGFLRLLYPYLRLKKPQAELAIKFQEARGGTGCRFTDEERAIAEAQRIVMGKFNKTGVI